MDERRLNWETVGLWLIGLGLLFGLWRVWVIEQALEHTVMQQVRLMAAWVRFQQAVGDCERLVTVLGASASPVVRVSGVEPAAVQAQLRERTGEAERAFRAMRNALEPPLQQPDAPETLHWAAIRTEMEWQQISASLWEYLRHADARHISLGNLHAFHLKGQDSLQAALQSLQQALSAWHGTQIQQGYAQRWLALGFCALMGALLMGWLWHFYLRPARLMTRWLQTEDADLPLHALRGTRWESVARTMLAQRERLRQVERFMRDLAMGRTPKPLDPQQPNDPLARSSRWLLHAIEKLRTAPRDREAV